MNSRRYNAYCGERRLGSFSSLAEALRALSKCDSGIVVERCETVIRLSKEEYAEMFAQRPGSGTSEALQPQPPSRPAPSQAAAAIVFDQMFKRFAEILDRELADVNLEFHEIIGRGLEKPLRVSQRIYQQPARDDYDVIKLLEDLSNKHRKVIFFTGDRRLAAQARALPGVYVVYLPPGEVTGKEMAIKLMKKEIARHLEDA